MASILSVARRHGVRVIEDCAQAHGAVQSGRKAGAWGDAAAFSFYPTKNLGAFGDGGLVLTDDVAVAERIRMLRQYGWRDRYVSEIPGGNSRLDELQAALLRVKLRHLDSDNGRRMAIARAYDQRLPGSGLHLPEVRKDAVHVFHQYVVRHPCRNALKRYLEREGIQTLIHYPVPVHLQPAYAGRVPVLGPFRNTEEAAAQVLSFPMFPQLTDEQVERVCAAVHRTAGLLRESTHA
jgi:dTDP-4-amino-4,6-dideoxygalactose transaminase